MDRSSWNCALRPCRRARRRERLRAARRQILRFARAEALRCARRHPCRVCTIEEVRARLARFGHSPSALGTTAGSVFRTDDWRPTRLRRRTRRADGHLREVIVWRRAGRGVEGADQGDGQHAVVVEGADELTQALVLLELLSEARRPACGGAT